MSVPDTLKGVPYWRALAIFLIGVSATLAVTRGLGAEVDDAVASDNKRDDAVYVHRDQFEGATRELVLIRERLDNLIRVVERNGLGAEKR